MREQAENRGVDFAAAFSCHFLFSCYDALEKDISTYVLGKSHRAIFPVYAAPDSFEFYVVIMVYLQNHVTCAGTLSYIRNVVLLKPLYFIRRQYNQNAGPALLAQASGQSSKHGPWITSSSSGNLLDRESL